MLNTSEKPDQTDLPTWDDLPETQIVEITPEPSQPELLPLLEKNLIDKILNGDPSIFNLPKPLEPKNNYLN